MSAWQTWEAYPDATEVFQMMSSKPSDITDDDLAVLERCLVLLYDRTCELQTVNETRRYLFSKKSRKMENIPPSQAALLEHSKRAAFQAGHIWGQTLVSEPEVPTPGEWGWEELDKKWSILWTKLPEASKSCLELLCCKCQKACRGNCKCYKRNLRCTSLCACYEQCYQN